MVSRWVQLYYLPHIQVSGFVHLSFVFYFVMIHLTFACPFLSLGTRTLVLVFLTSISPTDPSFDTKWFRSPSNTGCAAGKKDRWKQKQKNEQATRKEEGTGTRIDILRRQVVYELQNKILNIPSSCIYIMYT